MLDPLQDAKEPELAGRYLLGNVLGRGGQAVVYEAYDRLRGRPVAVKILQEHLASDARFRARFRWEGNAAASIVHPNVAQVYEAGSDGGVEYIAMELVRGRPLSKLIREEGRLEAGRAIAIAAEVASALQAAHDRGLAHRDVKPGNVMITRDGHVKVIDFGIMRSIDRGEVTETLGLFGTAAYLSPEQAMGHPVDGRSDLYSLGCVLYEMLTGDPPYVDGSPIAVCAQHVHGTPAPPSRLRPDLAPAVEAVVLRALQKDPADRYASADDMRAALLAADSRGKYSSRARRRGRLMVAAGPALVALALGSLMIFAPWSGEQAGGTSQAAPRAAPTGALRPSPSPATTAAGKTSSGLASFADQQKPAKAGSGKPAKAGHGSEGKGGGKGKGHGKGGK